MAVAAITASAVTTAAPAAAPELAMAPTELADEPRIDVLAATEGALEDLQTVPSQLRQQVRTKPSSKSPLCGASHNGDYAEPGIMPSNLANRAEDVHRDPF